MRFSEFFIKRPVFTTMLGVAIITLGIFSYLRIGVDLFPNVEFPFVTVKTILRGASPEEIESSVTKVIEEAVNTINGIEDLASTSYEGMSLVMIKFDLDRDPDIAAQEVRDKVNAILSQLPQGTDPPVVSKVDFGAMPIINIAVSGDRDIVNLTETVKKRIKEMLETVNGVGSVDIVGGRNREIHVILDPLKMQAYQITVKQVIDSIRQQNVEVPGGNVEQMDMDFVLRTMGRVKKVSDFNDILITSYNGALIKLKDIGSIKDTGEDIKNISYLNGKPAVTLVIKKQSGTNTVKVIENIKEKLNEIKKILPPDMKVEIVGDQSVFINGSLNAVKEHLVLGALLASLVILLFIGDLRSTIISAIAIPVSVIGSFSLMEISGFTLNNITLLALVVGVGLVIDDAIVMIENIHRHLEQENTSSLDAAISGSREIGFAVLAISISLLAIFVPLAYMSGMVGRFMKSFGLTLAYSIAISTLVALTITPSYSGLLLRKLKETKFRLFAERLNETLASYYIKILSYALSHIKFMVVSSLILMIMTFFMIKFIGKNFLPVDDTSMFQVNIAAKEGTNLEIMKKLIFQIESEIKNNVPYITKTLVNIGISQSGISNKNEGYIFFEIVGVNERKESLEKIMAKVRKMLSKYEGLRTSVIVGGQGSISGMKNYEMEYVVMGSDLNILQGYANSLISELKKIDGVVDLDTSFSNAKPEYKIIIDRDRAHKLGVKIEDIANTIRNFVSGQESVTKYKEGDELYEVKVRAEEKWRNSPQVIKSLVVPSSVNKVVRLDAVSDIEAGYGPTQIDRFNRQRKISIYANVEGKASLSQLLNTCDEVFRKINNNPQYQAQPVGKAKEFGRMLKSFLMAFIFAFLFVYIVLAAQFESFTYPVSIIIILPLTLPFALISLYITGSNLTIFALMGMFMLFGIVKKNSILQVDYTNTLRAKGYDRHKAIIEANRTRLRPILMTTITLVFAMIPTALGTGPGAGMRRSLAGVIIGGQVLSLLITLLMTPVTYVLMDNLQNWIKNKFKTRHT
ncbi:MAG: efflux RND transporter permease subunit [Elusimicrobiota bacterium]